MLNYVGAGTVPSAGPTPGITHWQSYVLGRWPGGVDLGAFGVRNMRGSDRLSVHAVGRAWDWRYADPGPGRQTAEDAMAFTIEHYDALGIQAIHDYVGCRIWRCDRNGRGPGWKQQQPGNGMGGAWAQWLHFEVHPDSALHHSTAEQVLAGAGVDTAVVVPDPPASTASLPLPTLRPGDHKDEVVQLQQVLTFWKLYTATVDGDYGPKTAAAVTAWQVALQPLNVGRPDGVYGPRTHAAAAVSYASLDELAAA